MSRFTKLLAIILVLLAAILGFVAYRLAVAPKPAPPAPAVIAPSPRSESEGPKFPVVVAANKVTAGTPLTASDLQVAQWPIAVTPGFDDPAKLVGRSLRRDLAAGEPITPENVMTGLARHLEPGQRAVAIAVDDVVGGANQVVPGDYVDVFFLLDKKDEITGTQARLLQSRLRVLTYGSASIDGPAPGDAASAVNRGNPPQPARTATLAVPLEFVNELLLVSKSGRMQLALRAPEDDGAFDRSLFGERKPVLAGRDKLTPEQLAELQKPENKAFAGDSLVQVSNALNVPVVQPPTQRAPAPRSSSGGGSVQIWRGGKPEVMQY